MSGNPTADRLRAQLDRDSESPPDFWDPGVGGELFGQFNGWSSGQTQRGDTIQIATVRTDTGERFSVWCFHKVLKSELARVDPQPGEAILIRREPDRENADGLAYRVYRVAVDRDNADTDANPESLIPPKSDWTFLGDQMQ